MRLKKFIAVLAIVGMAAGLAAGCGKSDAGDGNDKRQKHLNGMLPGISPLYPGKMDLGQEGHLPNCSGLKMR